MNGRAWVRWLVVGVAMGFMAYASAYDVTV
jgi:hypothetical protein